MAIVMLFEAKGATEEQYQGANEQMGIRTDADAPDGLISHVAARADDGVLVVDVWESEEKLGRFFEERLGAALAANGMDAGEPTIMPVHNLIEKGAGSAANVLVLVEAEGFGPETYDAMTASMDAHVTDGSSHPAVSHVAATRDGGVFVADVWESPEAFGAFAQEQIGPAGAAVGLGPIEPRVLPVIGRITRG